MNLDYLKPIFEIELWKLAGTYLASERTEFSWEEDELMSEDKEKGGIEVMFYLKLKIGHNFSYFLIHWIQDKQNGQPGDSMTLMSDTIEEGIDLNDYNSAAF